jgi:hypothetical protein
VLDYHNKPSVIVLLTDGEETRGRRPCDLGKALHAKANHLAVHVIGLRAKGYSWTGEQSFFDVKCLTDQNEGLYITVEQEDELIDALEKTLGCPMLSQVPDLLGRGLTASDRDRPSWREEARPASAHRPRLGSRPANKPRSAKSDPD